MVAMTGTDTSAGESAAEELRRRANAQRANLASEEPQLLETIEELFIPALRWYFGTLRDRKIRPWGARQGPDKEAFAVAFAAEWRVTWVRFLQEQLRRHGSFTLDAARHVGADLLPISGPAMTIGVSEDFVLSARALHQIGAEVRAALPSGTRFPKAAARWLELLGYEIVNVETRNAP